MDKKKRNDNPFRVKKVGKKWKYDFVSYDEWEKMMNKKKPIDILQGKFRHFTGDVELDDENEDLTNRVYSGETIVGDKKKMHWTEDGWKEGEKENYDFEGSLEDLEVWLKEL
jgi:hypothetical protein|tara:strand:+ start:300 stop:635 length:336 start_codon:yes stop_codon:yes gene_type:complete